MSKTLRILIISDSFLNVHQINKVLKGGGFKTICNQSKTSNAASLLSENTNWDLVIIDFNRKKSEISMVVNLIKSIGPDSLVFVISDTYDDGVIVETIKNGAHNYILRENLSSLPASLKAEMKAAMVRRAKKRAEEKVEKHHSQLSLIANKRTKQLKALNLLLEDEVKEHKQMAEALRESNERFMAIFNDAAVGIALADMRGCPIEVNSAFERMVGYNKEELKNMVFLDFTHPEDLLLDIQEWNNFKKSKLNSFSLDKRYVKKDGRSVWVHLTVSLIKDADGKPKFSIGVIQDVTDQKMAEQEKDRISEELKLQRDTLLTIMEYTGANIAYLDSGFNFIEVSSSYIKGSGYSRSELIGKNHFDLFPNKGNQSIFERVRRTGIPETYYAKPFEFKDQPSRGITYWDWSLMPVKNSDNKVRGLVLSLLDVTENVKTQEALRQTEERFRRIFDDSPIGIELYDATGKLVEINKACLDIFGVSNRENVMGFDLFEDPNLPLDVKEKIKKGGAVKFEMIFDFEKVKGDKSYKTSRSGIIDLDVLITPMRAGKGKTLFGYLIQAQDVTERKVTENRLRESEAKFRSVAQSANDAIISTEKSGKIVSWNKGAEKIFRYKETEVLKKSLANIITGQNRSRYKKIVANAASHYDLEAEKISELMGLRKGGDKFPLELSISVWEMDRDTFFTAIIRDITERKELERRKDEFISIASHELRTPLTSIKAFIQIFQKRFYLLDEEKRAHLLSRMDIQVNKLTGLIFELLDVTRIQSGKLELKKEEFVVGDLVKDVVEEIQTSTDSSHKIVIDKINNSIIVGDKYRISQALANLLTNAIKYSPGGDKVIVRISDGGNMKNVTISVQDFGIGIPNEKRKHIFERFYQAHSEFNGGGGVSGLGLGLFISSEIIKRHKGKMWVRSEEGKGSTFFFQLPAKGAK